MPSIRLELTHEEKNIIDIRKGQWPTWRAYFLWAVWKAHQAYHERNPNCTCRERGSCERHQAILARGFRQILDETK